jgi:hypothetical protein
MNTIKDMRTILEGMWRMPEWRGKKPIIGLAAILIAGIFIVPTITIVATALVGGFFALETRKPHVRNRIAAERAQGHR